MNTTTIIDTLVNKLVNETVLTPVFSRNKQRTGCFECDVPSDINNLEVCSKPFVLPINVERNSKLMQAILNNYPKNMHLHILNRLLAGHQVPAPVMCKCGSAIGIDHIKAVRPEPILIRLFCLYNNYCIYNNCRPVDKTLNKILFMYGSRFTFHHVSAEKYRELVDMYDEDLSEPLPESLVKVDLILYKNYSTKYIVAATTVKYVTSGTKEMLLINTKFKANVINKLRRAMYV